MTISYGTLFENALSTLSRWRLLVIGGSLWWCGHFLMLYRTDIASRVSDTLPHDLLWFTCVLMTLIVCAILLASARARRGLSRTPAYPLLLACLVSGLLCLAASPDSVPTLVGSGLIGLGIGVGIALYGLLHARCPHRSILLLCGLEELIALALFAGISLSGLPALPSTIVIVALSVVCFFLANKVPPAEQGKPAVVIDISTWQIALLAFLISLPYGLVRSMLSAEEGQGLPTLSLMLVGSLIASLLLLGMYFSRRSWTLIAQCAVIVVPLTAASMVLLPFSSLNHLAPAAVGNAGFVCFFMLQYHYSAAMAGMRPDEPSAFLKALSLFTVANNAGQIAGALVPSPLANAVSSLAIYAILVFCVGAFARMRRTPHAADQGQANEPVEGPLAAFARTYDLTPREQDVLAMLARRHSYEEMAEELCIAPTTVKTHVRNIYRKTETASRKELLRKMEAEGDLR